MKADITTAIQCFRQNLVQVDDGVAGKGVRVTGHIEYFGPAD